MLERHLEQYLVFSARAVGALALKWVSPSMAGVPDRIVIIPGGRVVFVELKAPGKKPSPLQLRTIERLRAVGAEVRVIDSKENINALFA